MGTAFEEEANVCDASHLKQMNKADVHRNHSNL